VHKRLNLSKVFWYLYRYIDHPPQRFPSSLGFINLALHPKAVSTALEAEAANTQLASLRQRPGADFEEASFAEGPQSLPLNDLSRRPYRETTETTEKCRTCIIPHLLWMVVEAPSLVVGPWRSFATHDEGKGFTDAAYVVTVSDLFVYPIQTRHNQRYKSVNVNPS